MGRGRRTRGRVRGRRTRGAGWGMGQQQRHRTRGARWGGDADEEGDADARRETQDARWDRDGEWTGTGTGTRNARRTRNGWTNLGNRPPRQRWTAEDGSRATANDRERSCLGRARRREHDGGGRRAPKCVSRYWGWWRGNSPR